MSYFLQHLSCESVNTNRMTIDSGTAGVINAISPAAQGPPEPFGWDVYAFFGTEQLWALDGDYTEEQMVNHGALAWMYVLQMYWSASPEWRDQPNEGALSVSMLQSQFSNTLPKRVLQHASTPGKDRFVVDVTWTFDGQAYANEELSQYAYPTPGFSSEDVVYPDAVACSWSANVPGNMLDRAIKRVQACLAYDVVSNPLPTPSDAPRPGHALKAVVWCNHSTADVWMSEEEYLVAMRDAFAAIRAELGPVLIVVVQPLPVWLEEYPDAAMATVMRRAGDAEYFGMDDIVSVALDGIGGYIVYADWYWWQAPSVPLFQIESRDVAVVAQRVHDAIVDHAAPAGPVVREVQTWKDHARIQWTSPAGTLFTDVVVDGALVEPHYGSECVVPRGSSVTLYARWADGSRSRPTRVA